MLLAKIQKWGYLLIFLIFNELQFISTLGGVRKNWIFIFFRIDKLINGRFYCYLSIIKLHSKYPNRGWVEII
jgi:hypothetical protein